jgi:SAM-dependent methyltransferase
MHTLTLPTPLPPALPEEPDLFGRMLLDYHLGRGGEHWIRRDDNEVVAYETARYFRSWETMPAHHRCLLSHARGNVLDLGAGAGQHALALQERGFAVTAADHSPHAVETCRRRGVRDARVIDGLQLNLTDAGFDTVLLMQNSLGLAGSLAGLRYLLRRLHAVVRPGGQLLTDIHDDSASRDTRLAGYQRLNRIQGRYPGTVRLRVEYDGRCSPWFDWLRVTLADLRSLCLDTGWRLARCVQVDATPLYMLGIVREETER